MALLASVTRSPPPLKRELYAPMAPSKTLREIWKEKTMGISIRRGLQIVLLSAAWLHASSALAQEEGIPPDPETLSQTNILVDGGFHDDLMGCDCAWQMERSAGVDGTQPGAMFLNGGLPGAISAIHQSLNELTPGQVYSVAVQWRAVGHEAEHSTVAQTGLSLELDGTQLHQLVPAGPPLEWNTHEVQFTAGAPRARLTLRSLGKSTESGIQLNYVNVLPLEEGLPETGNDIVVSTPDLGEPIELTENGLVIPPLPGPVFADDRQEPQRMAEQMPARTRLMAYSINDEVRGQTNTEDYFFDVDEDGRGKIILGQGLNFDVVGVDEVVTGDDFNAFAAAAMAMSGIDLKSDDVVMLRAANGSAQGGFLSVFDDHSEFSPQFSPDNVFVVRPPLETEASAGFVSFEAAFLPGEFIRHQGYFLKLDPVTEDSPTLDKRDATFELVEVSSPVGQASCPPATPANDRGRKFCEGVLAGNGVTADGKKWSEDEVFRMCTGILNPQMALDRVMCVREAYASNPNVAEAISACLGNADTACATQPAAQQPAQPAEPQQSAVQPEPFAAFPECVKLLTDGGTLDWGDGTQWNPPNAERLCAGVNSAEDIVRRFSCFEEDLAATSDWSVSIDNCTGNARAATGEQPAVEQPAAKQPAQAAEPRQSAVQPEPAGFPECVKLLTGGGTLDWGGGTQWNPPNAERLCAGVNSAEDIVRRFSCFEEDLAATSDWSVSIDNCTGNPQAANGEQPAVEQPATQQPAQATEPQQSADQANPDEAWCVRTLTISSPLLGSTGSERDLALAARLCAGVNNMEDVGARFKCYSENFAANSDLATSVANCSGVAATPLGQPEPASDPAAEARGFCLQTLESFAAELLGSKTPEGDGDRLCGGVNSTDEAGAKLICVGNAWQSTGNWEQAIASCSGETQTEPGSQSSASALPMDRLGEDGGVFYGEAGGIPIAIGSDQIGIEYDPKEVALKIIKGDGLNSTVTLAFSGPISGLEIDVGDYDVSDGTNPVVAGRSAEYMSGFSVFPSAVNGALTVLDGGEVHSNADNGGGTLVWRDLQDVQAISFVHHRGLPGLGVFLKGVRVTP
jgi:hypothetical protein